MKTLNDEQIEKVRMALNKMCDIAVDIMDPENPLEVNYFISAQGVFATAPGGILIEPALGFITIK